MCNSHGSAIVVPQDDLAVPPSFEGAAEAASP
jgi:hypothetical protein